MQPPSSLRSSLSSAESTFELISESTQSGIASFSPPSFAYSSSSSSSSSSCTSTPFRDVEEHIVISDNTIPPTVTSFPPFSSFSASSSSLLANPPPASLSPRLPYSSSASWSSHPTTSMTCPPSSFSSCLVNNSTVNPHDLSPSFAASMVKATQQHPNSRLTFSTLSSFSSSSSFSSVSPVSTPHGDVAPPQLSSCFSTRMPSASSSTIHQAVSQSKAAAELSSSSSPSATTYIPPPYVLVIPLGAPPRNLIPSRHPPVVWTFPGIPPFLQGRRVGGGAVVSHNYPVAIPFKALPISNVCPTNHYSFSSTTPITVPLFQRSNFPFVFSQSQTGLFSLPRSRGCLPQHLTPEHSFGLGVRGSVSYAHNMSAQQLLPTPWNKEQLSNRLMMKAKVASEMMTDKLSSKEYHSNNVTSTTSSSSSAAIFPFPSSSSLSALSSSSSSPSSSSSSIHDSNVETPKVFHRRIRTPTESSPTLKSSYITTTASPSSTPENPLCESTATTFYAASARPSVVRTPINSTGSLSSAMPPPDALSSNADSSSASPSTFPLDPPSVPPVSGPRGLNGSVALDQSGNRESQYEALREKYNELDEINYRLRQENAKLGRGLAELRDTVKAKHALLSELRKSNSQLSIELERSRRNVDGLRSKCRQAKDHYGVLIGHLSQFFDKIGKYGGRLSENLRHRKWTISDLQFLSHLLSCQVMLYLTTSKSGVNGQTELLPSSISPSSSSSSFSFSGASDSHSSAPPREATAAAATQMLQAETFLDHHVFSSDFPPLRETDNVVKGYGGFSQDDEDESSSFDRNGRENKCMHEEESEEFSLENNQLHNSQQFALAEDSRQAYIKETIGLDDEATLKRINDRESAASRLSLSPVDGFKCKLSSCSKMHDSDSNKVYRNIGYDEATTVDIGDNNSKREEKQNI